VTVTLGTIGFNILPAIFYTLRASIVLEGATNRIQLFIDGFQLISTTDSSFASGSVGFFHDADASLEVDDAEVMQLSLGVDELGINEFP
jgi:hypothetical protein